MDGTDKMEVEFGDEKKQRENTHQDASILVMTTWLTSRTNMSNKVEEGLWKTETIDPIKQTVKCTVVVCLFCYIPLINDLRWNMSHNFAI